MKHLDLAASDATIARATAEFMCALRFESNRKANRSRVLELCEKADLFKSKPAEKKTLYLVGFARVKKSAILCSAVIDEMRTSSWKYSIFANERVVKNKMAVVNFLDCYCTSLKCKNTKAHCHKVTNTDQLFDDGGRSSFTIKLGRDRDDPPEPEPWLLPCQMLDGFVSLSKHDEVSPADRLDAAAVKRVVNICPNYRSEGFGPIKTIEPKKRYWGN